MKKVIFHIDESSKWNLTIHNAINLLISYQQSVTEYSIVIVANGDSVKDLATKQFEFLKELHDIQKANVSILACENSLRSLAIESTNLLDGIKVIPSGVVEIVNLQQGGYTYIKP